MPPRRGKSIVVAPKYEGRSGSGISRGRTQQRTTIKVKKAGNTPGRHAECFAESSERFEAVLTLSARGDGVARKAKCTRRLHLREAPHNLQPKARHLLLVVGEHRQKRTRALK